MFEQYPVVTVTGPRQSGKTMQVDLPGKYVNLEAPDQRRFAECQDSSAPDLLSYLCRNGQFVLTGSEQFAIQVNANRSRDERRWRALPFSLAERRQTGAGEEVDDMLFSGGYPRIHDQGLDPSQALGDYFETYIERDVRRIGDLHASFQRFGLCRVGNSAWRGSYPVTAPGTIRQHRSYRHANIPRS